MVTSYRVRRAAASRDALLSADPDAWTAASPIDWGLAPYTTRFAALHHSQALLLRFDASDLAPWSSMTRRDDRLWTEEVVEIFLDPAASGRDYAELEISPSNVVCDLIVRQPWPSLVSDASWHFEGLETRTRAWAAPEAGPDGWTATAAIPWSAFSALPAAPRLPPAAGDRWRFNVFRIKRPHGPERPDDDVVYAAWSPTGGPSFHVPDAFRDLVFE